MVCLTPSEPCESEPRQTVSAPAADYGSELPLSVSEMRFSINNIRLQQGLKEIRSSMCMNNFSSLVMVLCICDWLVRKQIAQSVSLKGMLQLQLGNSSHAFTHCSCVCVCIYSMRQLLQFPQEHHDSQRQQQLHERPLCFVSSWSLMAIMSVSL